MFFKYFPKPYDFHIKSNKKYKNYYFLNWFFISDVQKSSFSYGFTWKAQEGSERARVGPGSPGRPGKCHAGAAESQEARKCGIGRSSKALVDPGRAKVWEGSAKSSFWSFVLRQRVQHAGSCSLLKVELPGVFITCGVFGIFIWRLHGGIFSRNTAPSAGGLLKIEFPGI